MIKCNGKEDPVISACTRPSDICMHTRLHVLIKRAYVSKNMQLASRQKQRICSTRKCDSLEVVRKQYIFIVFEALQELQHVVLYVLLMMSIYPPCVFINGVWVNEPNAKASTFSHFIHLHPAYNTTEKNIVRIITGND